MRGTVRRLLWFAAPLALAAPVFAAVMQAAPPAATPNPLELRYTTPNAARGAALAASCVECHGPGGVSDDTAIPRLAGQVASYHRGQLAAYRAKVRPGGLMQQIAAGLGDQDIADLAAHFAGQAAGPAWPVTDAALRARGEALFLRGDPARNLIACAVCHGTDGRGEDRLGMAGVTHQAPGYTLETLRRYKNTPSFAALGYAEAMRIAVIPLPEADLTALAAYVSSMAAPR